jgi:hypothetical protein
MPVAAFAVSGCGRAVSSWLNLVERLGFGPDDQLAPAWHPSQRPGAGGARSPPGPGNGCGWANLTAVLAAMDSGDSYVNVHADDGWRRQTPALGTSPAGRSAATSGGTLRQGSGNRARPGAEGAKSKEG